MKAFIPVIKRALVLCLCGAMLLSAAACEEASESLPPPKRESVSQRDFSQTLGEILTLGASPDGAKTLVNDSGMSGIEAANHLHGTKVSDMFYAGSAEEATVTFDTGKLVNLGQMHIWNYNEAGKTDSGMKEIKVSYSVDGEEWTYLSDSPFVLEKSDDAENEAYRGNLAANTGGDKHEPIDFAGALGRYVKIEAVSNWGGEGFGLSEVRLFRHKIRPKKGEVIPAESFSPYNTETSAENVSNGYGMDGDKCGTDKNTMWLCEDTAVRSSLMINLDGNYPVNKIKIWNYNDPDNLGKGIKEFRLFYTTGAPCTVTEEDGLTFGSKDWINYGDFTLEQGTGKDGMKPSLVIDLPKNTRVQHIKIVPRSSYSGENTGFGLSAVSLVCGSGWAAEPARNWTGLFSSSGSFPYQNSMFTDNDPSGWLAADGIHAINVATDDNSQMQGSTDETTKTLFTFQDTMKGNMKNFNKDSFSQLMGYDMNHYGMVNHSYMFLKGSEPDPRNAEFIIAGAKDASKHPLGDIFPEQYWIGDSTLINGMLYSLANGFDVLRITKSDFYEVKIDPETGFPDYKNTAPKLIHGQNKSFTTVGGVTLHFDTVLELTVDKKDYIYTFARGADGNMVVARMLAKDYPKYQNIEYWNGSSWKGSIGDLTFPRAAISTYRPGNEFSVSYLNSGPFAGKYINVFTRDSVDGLVQFSVSEKVTGKFDDPTDLYFPSEMYKIIMERYPDYEYDGQKDLYQWIYNAKAQPAISKKGELLVSYHYGAQNIPPLNAYGFASTAIEYAHPWFVCMYEIEGK